LYGSEMKVKNSQVPEEKKMYCTYQVNNNRLLHVCVCVCV